MSERKRKPLPLSEGTKKEFERVREKALKVLETLPPNDPAKLMPLDEAIECPFCGKIFFGLMSFGSHTAASHKLSALEVWEIEQQFNPSRR